MVRRWHRVAARCRNNPGSDRGSQIPLAGGLAPHDDLHDVPGIDRASSFSVPRMVNSLLLRNDPSDAHDSRTRVTQRAGSSALKVPRP